jgi:hypothetical protein
MHLETEELLLFVITGCLGIISFFIVKILSKFDKLTEDVAELITDMKLVNYRLSEIEKTKKT